MNPIYGKKCLLDTNVFLFAYDRSSSHHNLAVRLFKELEEGKFQGFFSIQTILEFGAVLTSGYKITEKEVLEDTELILAHPKLKVLFPLPSLLPDFLALLNKDSHLYIFDLYLIATAKIFGIEVIITADEDFQRIKDISVYNPFKTT